MLPFSHEKTNKQTNNGDNIIFCKSISWHTVWLPKQDRHVFKINQTLYWNNKKCQSARTAIEKEKILNAEITMLKVMKMMHNVKAEVTCRDSCQSNIN